MNKNGNNNIMYISFKLVELLIIIVALVAQSVERQAVNLQVDCSNQSWGAFFFPNYLIYKLNN